MKDAVARTKNFSTEASSTTTTTRQPSPLSSAVSAASPLPTPTTEPLSRHAASGWLNKLGDKGLIKSWKKRWFAQRAERLYYYETKEETGLKGFVDLTLVTAVAESPKVKHGFELRTKDRIYYLQAATDDERAQLDGRSPQKAPTTPTPSAGATTSSSNGGPTPLSQSARRTLSFSQNPQQNDGPQRNRGETVPVAPAGEAWAYGTRERAPSLVAEPAGVSTGRAARELSIERSGGADQSGTTPSSFREEEIRALQQKLLSLEAKLDTSAKSVPTRALAPDTPSSSSSSSPSTSPSPSPSTHAPAITSPAPAAAAAAAEEQLRAMEKKLAAAEEEARRATARLEHLKEKYSASKHKTKTAEQRIEGLTEDVNHLTKESRAKDEHIASLKASAASSASSAAPPATQLEETIAQLRQATHAHQTQNAYLASEIKKLQREHTIELASRDEQLDGLRAQLELARSSSASDSSIEAEFAALQRLYFSALAVGIKLNLMLQGQPCNIDAASLWSKAQALNLHFSKWNEWVLARYEEAFDD
ncbi:PH domain containing protein [Acanthamoeba castellanii str. Neff]|uniref:PH domain containing protein n=1 Tax=Acanthamoeba castellanii (strain ATCC 30010 / Neff) TaxID=1257118 RepID=L8H3K0_ACACF|nr:PH domain containing protein [Acanthamoeba castellanii str. Neff]ELR19001.1 PH domain containing protein [Acanthamoeba castellanii str. Neff]